MTSCRRHTGVMRRVHIVAKGEQLTNDADGIGTFPPGRAAANGAFSSANHGHRPHDRTDQDPLLTLIMRDSSGEGGFHDNLAHTRTLLALDACHQPNHEVHFMRLASTPTWEAETRDKSPVCCCCLRPVLSRCLCPMFTRVTLSPEWLHTTLQPLTHVLTGLGAHLTLLILRRSSVQNAYECICFIP